MFPHDSRAKSLQNRISTTEPTISRERRGTVTTDFASHFGHIVAVGGATFDFKPWIVAVALKVLVTTRHIHLENGTLLSKRVAMFTGTVRVKKSFAPTTGHGPVNYAKIY